MNESKVSLEFSREELELVARKLKTINPTLFCEAFLRAKFTKPSTWKLLKRVWKKSKGNAVVMVLVLPFARFLTRKPEIAFQKYTEIFKESNRKLEKALPKADTKNEKMFIKTFIELNTIGIEMSTLFLEEIEKNLKAKRLREKLRAEPTTENILNLWKNTIEFSELESNIARMQNQKADIQDKVIAYEKQMTKLDKRDIEDFWRVILTDMAISYEEKKILIIGTPIEILMKSSKIVSTIKKPFWLSDTLRESAKERRESINELVEWFVTYEDKAQNKV